MTAVPAFRMDLGGALEFSRYAQRLAAAQPALAARVAASLDSPFHWDEPAIAALADASDTDSLAVALRRLRQRVLFTIIARDLTGRAELGEVCATMTRLAEISIATAVAAHHRRLAAVHGEPVAAESRASQRLLVIGMGKLGGGELNVSSDVDLVFAYPEDGQTPRARSRSTTRSSSIGWPGGSSARSPT